jgi:uncharacterized protein YcbK (DUF882 family)
LERRDFLKWGCRCATMAAAACLVPHPLPAAPRRALSAKRLTLYNLHTEESLHITYAENGRHLPEALESIDHILRDFRTGEVKEIDPGLLDLLHAISKKMGLTKQHPLQIVSGYRSLQTNAMLRERSSGIAEKSYHLTGQAVDFRVPAFQLSHLRKAALSLRAGGVGYYPRSDFLHVDVGEFRYW